MTEHAKKHAINDANDHAPGTPGTVIGSDPGPVLSQIPFGTSVNAGWLAQRRSGGQLNVPTTPVLSTDAASKAYVDGLITGLSWKEPALVRKMKSDVVQAGSPPVATVVGEAWVCRWWGAPWNDGDIAEWDGTQWNLIQAGVGGEVPLGTRVIVIDSGAAGQFTGHEDEVGTAYSINGNAWTFESPADGWALLVIGENSIFENNGYVYDSTPGAWIHFATQPAVKLKADVILAGASPVAGDVSGAGWVSGDKGIGIGTDASRWFMTYDGVNVYSVKMT